MRVSRRTFLGAVGVGPALASGRRPICRVVDLGCLLPESLAGFRGQVGDLPYTDMLIVPGVAGPAGNGRMMIQSWLARGATVLLEYAAGKRVEHRNYFPYVEYNWPVPVKIREFAPVRLHPVPGDQIIATFHGQPVGLRRSVGHGTLVTLGSPLGPVFLAGDPDARLWLDALSRL